MDRLLIVDGHAYAYRAFHAIRSLRSPDGRPTNAIYGFVKMLAKMRAAIQPTHSVVVWDGGLSAERLAALPAYKAQRPEMPDDLKPQLDEIVSCLKAAGVASICREGVEADDYIACLARRAADAGMAVVIASSDKDFMQLVSARIGLLNPNDKTETIWTDEQVRAKTGLAPAQIVDWLSLTGDNVDNIPGVPGVGPKTAADLLGRFGSVRVLYERLDAVESEKLRANLRAAEAAVWRNRGLVRLREDLPCEFSPAELVEKPADTGRLRELYRRWGFKTLLAVLEDRDGGAAAAAREKQAVLI
ncbi:MAG: 5'-3' exonuclease H3TH domain-containing protein [Verrucomicrobiia bacterium]